MTNARRYAPADLAAFCTCVFESFGVPRTDAETAAIEAGANDFSILAEGENDYIPAGTLGVKFLTERTATAAVSKWLSQNGLTVVTSELGFVPKQLPELTDEQRAETGEFLQALEDHDDAHRVWAAFK